MLILVTTHIEILNINIYTINVLYYSYIFYNTKCFSYIAHITHITIFLITKYQLFVRFALIWILNLTISLKKLKF
jgi:hypothetical protein